MRRHRWWAVVGYRRRGPGEAYGPYLSRADADDVRRKLTDPSDEENVEVLARGWRYRVVAMDRLITTREFEQLMADRG